MGRLKVKRTEQLFRKLILPRALGRFGSAQPDEKTVATERTESPGRKKLLCRTARSGNDA